MPRTINEGFDDFLKKLTPTDSEREAAKSHRSSIETRLKNDFDMKNFFRIGSFGNGTSISGYSDVDYLASLKSNFYGSDSSYSLSKVRKSLDERFPATGVNVRCPAVVVPFGTTRSETTEIVPANFISRENDCNTYEISDCNVGWMKVSPEAHNNYVRKIDQKLNGQLKPLIRFIKAWKYFQNVPISSFYLELRVAKYADTETSILHYIDIKSIFKLLQNIELASIQDPTGVSGCISACKTSADQIIALSKLNTAVVRSERAYNEIRSEKISDAFDSLRMLYNYEFPTYCK